jgi:hypothetical protein
MQWTTVRLGSSIDRDFRERLQHHCRTLQRKYCQ